MQKPIKTTISDSTADGLSRATIFWRDVLNGINGPRTMHMSHSRPADFSRPRPGTFCASGLRIYAHSANRTAFSRRMHALLLAAGLVLSLAINPAFAISNLTESQVRNVCGGDLKKSTGHFGCTKACADKKSTCIYDCSEKTKICSGLSVALPPISPSKH